MFCPPYNRRSYSPQNVFIFRHIQNIGEKSSTQRERFLPDSSQERRLNAIFDSHGENFSSQKVQSIKLTETQSC